MTAEEAPNTSRLAITQSYDLTENNNITHSPAVLNPREQVALGLEAELISKYFERLSPLPSYNFLHEATVRRRSANGTLNEGLKLSICAITAHFLGTFPEEQKGWIDRSENLSLAVLCRPSIFQLQAMLLIIRHRAEQGQFYRAFMLTGLAARLAMGLRLNFEHPELPQAAQEARRRTFWSLFLVGDLFCVGLREFELCSPDIIHLRLPCGEQHGELETASIAAFLQPGKCIEPETLSIRTLYPRLVFFRRQIMRLFRRIQLEEADSAEVLSAIYQLQNDLRAIKDKLAPEDQWSPVNSQQSICRPEYTLFHLSWHQCHCDIYRIFLSGFCGTEAKRIIDGLRTPEPENMGRKCLQHASHILQILSGFCYLGDGKQRLEFDAAVCAYHSCRLLLFAASQGTTRFDLDERATIEQVKTTLSLLEHFYKDSAPVKPMCEDLAELIDCHNERKKRANTLKSKQSWGYGKPSPGLSSSAMARQKLSIHSLLRQSNFVDDSNEAADSDGRNGHHGIDPSETYDSSHPSNANDALMSPFSLEWDLDPFSYVGRDIFSLFPDAWDSFIDGLDMQY